MNIPTKYLVFGSIIVLFALFFSGYIMGRKNGKDVLRPTVNAQENVISQYITKIRDMNIFVSKQEQEITTLHEALKNSELSREEIRKLHLKSLQEITRLKIQIDTLLHIKPETNVVVRDTCLKGDQSAILLPYSFKKVDKWLDLRGTINKSGVVDVMFNMPLNVDIFTNYDRKENKYTATVTTSNPYLGVKEIKSQKFDAITEKKWGIGMFLGYGLTINGKPQFSPLLGVGVSRAFFRF